MAEREEIKFYQNKLSKLKTLFDNASGAYNARLKILKDKFGFDNVEDAKKQLKKYEKEVDDLIDNRNDAIELFEKKYKDVLEKEI